VTPDTCMPREGPDKVPGTREEARQEASRCLATLECRFCNVCELLCPDQCITRDPRTGNILIDLNHCKGCGLCAHYCPKGAIRMELEPTD
jgi:Pyruvate/2-oxoacid:ferredoxin oxidoreductase delta subunit